METFKPLQDYVLIRPDKVEEKLASGLFVPTKDEQRKDKGVVVAVGPEVDFLAEGQTVAYRQWYKEDIEIAGEGLILTKKENIIGIYA